MSRYHRCFETDTPEAAGDITRRVRGFGGSVEVEACLVIVPDKLTFDYVDYHYAMKSGRKIRARDLPDSAPASPATP